MWWSFFHVRSQLRSDEYKKIIINPDFKSKKNNTIFCAIYFKELTTKVKIKLSMYLCFLFISWYFQTNNDIGFLWSYRRWSVVVFGLDKIYSVFKRNSVGTDPTYDNTTLLNYVYNTWINIRKEDSEFAFVTASTHSNLWK